MYTSFYFSIVQCLFVSPFRKVHARTVSVQIAAGAHGLLSINHPSEKQKCSSRSTRSEVKGRNVIKGRRRRVCRVWGSFCVSVASLGGQVLKGGEGGVAGGGRRHALHLARGVGGGAHAAQAAVQQVRRVAGAEVGQVGNV